MKNNIQYALILMLIVLGFSSCVTEEDKFINQVTNLLEEYEDATTTADMSALSDKEKEKIKVFFAALEFKKETGKDLSEFEKDIPVSDLGWLSDEEINRVHLIKQAIEFTEKMKQNVEKYETVELTTDLTWLSDNEREIIRILIDVSDIMDDIFWKQSYGNKYEELLEKVDNKYARQYVKINYGPWDRLDGNNAFIKNYDGKPLGANFYPDDMTREEFEAWDDPDKKSLYTLIRRDDDGNLKTIPYSEAYSEKHKKASKLMQKAAKLAEEPGLEKYLNMRAEALLTDDYQPSDFAWMEMRDSNLDFIVGPIENYEDRLYGYKAAHEAFILVKDLEWSKQLDRFNAMLPELQAGLPVEQQYKDEVPGEDSDINVYYAIYYAGDCNAGTKAIAVNLPNDEEVQEKAGSRKLQLKNSMKAKFDKIVIPISDMLIDEQQRKHVTFDAFFENVTFHEVAHGMGIRQTITGKGTVREALRDYYSPIEEAKADILGLYLITELYEKGELTGGEVMDNYVTFLAGIFRSCRFGAASAHGQANMMRFNYFERKGAFNRQDDGTYKINFDKMKDAVISSVKQILIIQGDGDYETAKNLVEKEGIIKEQLQEDLDRINEANIPVDIVFEQGPEVLGL